MINLYEHLNREYAILDCISDAKSVELSFEPEVVMVERIKTILAPRSP